MYLDFVAPVSGKSWGMLDY